MGHDRKLVISGVALVRTRFGNKDSLALGSVRDELEGILIDSEFLNQAPFQWVGLIIRYGLKDCWNPEYQKINKKHGDLPIAIEVDVSELLTADIERIRAKFREATLEALIQVGSKYKLPVETLMAAREPISKSMN